MLDVVPLIDEAAARVYALVRETPLVPLVTPPGVRAAGAAFAKLEQQQLTGSFKLRGATNKLMSLEPRTLAAGVIASSTGNHGLAVAVAAKWLGVDAEVYLSAEVGAAKREGILRQGARIRIAGDDALTAELAARAAALDSGRTYISPYNDAYVVAGQGTVAVEVLRQIPDLDAIYVAVGGGGLLGGIGAYLRHAAPHVEIIGCWPENSAVLFHCLEAGRIFAAAERATLSESTAGGVEEGSITFDLCRTVMHRGVLVGESEILDAMRWGRALGWAVEGASGVALAAYFREAHRRTNGKSVVLNCGGNPSPAVAALLDRGAAIK